MDFCRSSAGNEVVEAIGLEVDVGDIAAGQTTFGFEDVSMFPEKVENGVSALAGNFTAPPFAGRNAGTLSKVGRSTLAEHRSHLGLIVFAGLDNHVAYAHGRKIKLPLRLRDLVD
jgi:hypothetical protein